MTLTSLPPQAAVRIPHWLTLAQRTELSETIASVLRQTVVLPTTRHTFEEVLTELGVAQARDVVWPEKTQQVRAAAHLADDVLPIRMSHHELSVVLTLPLSDHLRTSLRSLG